MTTYKQAIILREDLDTSKGKMIAQACHASLKAYKKADKDKKQAWEDEGSRKIVLSANKSTMIERFQRAKSKGLNAAMIKDAGKTELKPGTKTSVAVGPAKESEVDSITGDLKLIN